MKLSVCIPNFNYERFIGETLRSVLDQDGVDLEVVISDNASTDRSLEEIERVADTRVAVHQNRVNVGFAANLDCAARWATGDLMLMLSSDDLLHPGSLGRYLALYEALDAPETSVVGAAGDVIDGEGRRTGAVTLDRDLWGEAAVDHRLSEAVGATVRTIDATTLLERCLRTMRTPFAFASAMYPRALHDAVEGYRAIRSVNPDKWFHWKLLGVAERAHFIDEPLFAYRMHDQNQTAIQRNQAALKYLVDEYTATLDVPDTLLTRAGVTRDDLVAAYVEYDIGRHGLGLLARGERARARRTLRFGMATYPSQAARNRGVKALAALLTAGPVGDRVAARAYRQRGGAT